MVAHIHKTDKARIILPDSFREPGTTSGYLFSGSGTNNRTGKEISFRVPDTISKKGLESIEKNIRFNNPSHYFLVVECHEFLFD